MALRLGGRRALAFDIDWNHLDRRSEQMRLIFILRSGDRLSSVIDTVNSRRSSVDSVTTSETDIINVVEQRVLHAMEEGQFEKLPGKGKPLDLSCNPHADPAEDTLYRILNKNGCAPEWVELNKEIRSNVSGWRSALKRACACKVGEDDSKWVESSEALKLQLCDINNKVFRYKLQPHCPLWPANAWIEVGERNRLT